MKVVIVGVGYVGLVTGACFANMGANVICVDIDTNKIDKLNKGIIPIFEPGLDDMVANCVKQNLLSFSSSLEESINDAELIFSAVGTPSDVDGSADLSYVLDVARTIGKNANNYLTLVTKSTVPVGTANKVKQVIEEELKARGVDLEFDVAANPEFLKQGDAIGDFMAPDRVVIGVESEKSQKLLEQLYSPIAEKGYSIMFMDIASAEMTKYAANAMLATRISFMNDIANLCELIGANVDEVRRGIGSDVRIGSKFLNPGIGYGGSCFPKDVKALSKIGAQNGYKMRIIDAVEEVNESQKHILFKKLEGAFLGDFKGKTIAIWGLTFKPDTDDIREAPSLVLINELLNTGAFVRVYDPVALEEVKERVGDKIIYCADKDDAVIGADAIVLVTEWKEFRNPNWKEIFTKTKGKLVVDGRNIFDESELRQLGASYYRIGKKV